MRKFLVWGVGVGVAALSAIAVAGRVQSELSPGLNATVPGDQILVAGAAQTAQDGAHFEPLSDSEIVERLGLGRGVLVSTWKACFPNTLTWDRKNVVDDQAGGVALRLSKRQGATARAYLGGEFQAKDYTPVWGRVEWQARLPAGISGSVAAMFLYKYPYDAKTDREFDLEYVPGDPKVDHEHGTMQMTLHMKRHDGSGAREQQSYRIEVPARCIEAVCGWAIEFQPKTIMFQIGLNEAGNQGGDWETIGRFSHGTGWDLTSGTAFAGGVNGKTQNFSSSEIWSEQPMTAFVSYWVTDDQIGWLGALDESVLLGDVPRFKLKSMKTYSFGTLSPFRPGDWSVAANGAVSIASIPNDDLRLSSIEYRVAGGNWVSLDASSGGADPLLGSPVILPVVAGQSIEIRSVARGPAFTDSGYQVTSDPSDRKIVPAQ